MSETSANELSIFDHLTATARHGHKFARQSEKETDKAFFERLLLALADISERIYEALPEDARAWCEHNAEELTQGRSVQPPDGFSSRFIAPDRRKLANHTTNYLRRIVYEDPTRLPGEIHRLMLERHQIEVKYATIISIKTWCLASVQILREMGWRPPRSGSV